MADGRAAELEWLGIPLADPYSRRGRIYARNVWDLQVHDERIYIGGGNSSNIGPATNAGPVPIVSFDPRRGIFVREAEVDDEQIDRFRVIDGRLYVPGHDPQESWEWGNVYVLASQGWVKRRTIPQSIHTYDLADVDRRLFAAVGARGGAAVAVSDDQAESWDVLPIPGFRAYTFINLAGRLYATGIVPADRPPSSEMVSVSEYADGRFLGRADLDAAALFPGYALAGDRPAKAPPVFLDTD